MLYRFNDQELTALVTFLDRVEYKGLKEAQLATRLIMLLNSPIKEDKEETE